MPVSTTLRFERCGNRSCTNILIELDEVIEETETFTTTLERTLGLYPRIRLTPVDGVVTIIDVSPSNNYTFVLCHPQSKNDSEVLSSYSSYKPLYTRMCHNNIATNNENGQTADLFVK